MEKPAKVNKQVFEQVSRTIWEAGEEESGDAWPWMAQTLLPCVFGGAAFK